MNYTKTKKTVIFELPLSDYFGKQSRRHYNNEIKKMESSQDWINSIQDWEEGLWDNFNSNYEYITLADSGKYYDLIDAEKYLITKGYTQAEINLFRDTLEEDQRRALADAFDSNYQHEYSQKLYKMIMDQVNEDFDNNLRRVDYKILDDLTDKDFQSKKTDQEYIRIEFSKADIREYLKENYPSEKYHLEKDYIDYFHDYALDFDRKEINREYIDYYGSIGSSDGWLDCFKNYNEIETEIDKYRLDEKNKIDNLERASLEIKPQIEAIANYVDKYITKEPEKTKINRQIKALKNVVKSAI